jgi:hypothetical protein
MSSKVGTLFTYNIKGAFDSVLRNRLILRLREQSWDPFLVSFAASFLERRCTQVRLQETTTD